MKLSILALLLSAACSSCAGRTVAPKLTPIIDLSVSIFTPDGFGKGCPVRSHIITARHLVERRSFQGGMFGTSWSDNYGHVGFADVDFVSNYFDGVMLVPLQGYPAPKWATDGDAVTGEQIFWFEYDFEKNIFASKLRRATLENIVAGHLIMSERPEEGASGGCIFNKKGEAIGIVVWGLIFEDHDDIGIGVAFPEEW